MEDAKISAGALSSHGPIPRSHGFVAFVATGESSTDRGLAAGRLVFTLFPHNFNVPTLTSSQHVFFPATRWCKLSQNKNPLA